jgi:serine/threonine-protein kinase
MGNGRANQVRKLLDASLARDAEARARFLEGISAVDPELAADVERLLEQTVTARESSAEPSSRNPSDAGGSAPVEGRRIGPYRVLQKIGQGGMGAVYLAIRDDDAFKKRVAIKILRRGMEGRDVQRFRNERQILASLEHPNVARLLDGGTTDDGSPYFVMEFVEGKPIDRYADSRKLSISDRLTLFLQVCAAAQFAHRNLIVHRDLKPSNILVTADGTPKLLDFGIAKFLNPELSSDAAAPTRFEERVMTPEYASPEQVRGEPITTASDVYSLGVLLYELLTGHRPYHIRSLAMHDITRVICEEEPTRPSTVIGQVEEVVRAGAPTVRLTPQEVSSLREGDPEKLRRRLLGDLDNVVLMAMRKEPERRYQSAAQFAEDVRRHLDGLPVIARKDTLPYRTQKFVQRHRAAVAAAVLIALSLVAGAAAATWQAFVAARERDQARREAQKAEEINAFVRGMLAAADPMNPGEGGLALTVADVLERAAARVDLDLASQPDVQAAVRATIGTAYQGLGLYDDAEAQLSEAVRIQEGEVGPEHPDVAVTRTDLAEVLKSKGDLTAAEPMYREAVEVLRKSLGAEAAEVADAVDGLAQLLQAKGELEEAERLQREALAIRRKRLGDDPRSVAESLNNLGVVLGTRGDYAAAEPLHREALAILEEQGLAADPHIAAGLTTLAFVLDQQGKYEEAAVRYREGLEMRRRLLGDEHPSVAWTRYNYADFLYSRGDYDEASRLSREALSLRGRILPDAHPVVSASLGVLGRSLMQLGDLDGAERALSDSLDVRRASLPAGHWLIASAESTLGECLVLRERFREAETLLLRSYEVLVSELGPEHPRSRESAERLGKLYHAWNQPEKADRYRAAPSAR